MSCTCSESAARFCNDCIGTGRADAAERSIGSVAAREQFKAAIVRQLVIKGEARIPEWMFREGWPGFTPTGGRPRPIYVHHA